MLAALYFLFFAELLGRTDMSGSFRYNLELLGEIKRFWTYREQLGMAAVLLNIAGNVLVFMPFGFFFPIISKRKINKKIIIIVIYSFLFSLGIEVLQMLLRVGAFDVDDLLLNTIGGFLGYIFYIVTRKVFHVKYYNS
ncbi:MAG: VanZ family protein [Eubacterium sp.]